MKYLCECCAKQQATLKDFREQYECIGKYFVCADCINKTDKSFFATMSARIRKEHKKNVGL